MLSPTMDSELIHGLVSAISTCSLYSREHSAVLNYANKALHILNSLFLNDDVSLTVIEGTLVLNEHRFTGAGDLAAGLARRLRQKKIGRVIFSRGLDIRELLDFIAGMASQESVTSTKHVTVGTVEIRETVDRQRTDDQYRYDIGLFADLYGKISLTRKIEIAAFDRIVAGFIDLISREKNILNIIGPFTSHSAYTLVHITNVTILSIFQAKALGIKNDLLRDIGLAALLHDVGKLFIPSAVINKAGKLDAEEWEKMKQHPVYGALYLSRHSDIPPIAPIVAYEHHMKYNGSGYPAPRENDGRPHLISQIVTIADIFEAMRMERPYKKPLDIVTIAGVLKEGSGKDFNPELVRTFLSALHETI